MQSEAESAGVTYSDEYYNLDSQSGWYVDTFTTDMQVGQVDEFINKENKWFNRIISSKSNLSTGDLTNDMGQIAVQGLGNPMQVPWIEDSFRVMQNDTLTLRANV